MKANRILAILSFGTLAIIILAMVAATVIEKNNGTPCALRQVYHNPVFFVLWAAAAVSGICLVVRATSRRHPWTLLIHISFAIILAGALLTHLTGEHGIVRLHKGDAATEWIRDDGSVRLLPCPIILEDFEVLYHTGTQTPSDYRSTVRAEGRILEISMNHIARIEGFRFHQSGFDVETSVLGVNHDPWGIGLTYTGYLLLIFSLSAFFFQRNTVFRNALKRVARSGVLPVAFVFINPSELLGPDCAMRAYNSISHPLIPFILSLAWGMMLFFLVCFSLSRSRPFPRKIAILSVWMAGFMFIYITLTLGLSWYLSGHAPFAGSYSVMMLLAWISSLVVCLFGRKNPLALPSGFLLAGFSMLVAYLSGSRLNQLAPVLQSPFLSIHVLTMMLSYSFLGLAALNGVLGLMVPEEQSGKLKDISLTVLYPAVFLLICGTFLGAVWANISWGSYWNWDPKETWALVTFLVYSFALHGNQLRPFRNPRFFHAFCATAFLCVLITYFGVNILLGGIHAYA